VRAEALLLEVVRFARGLDSEAGRRLARRLERLAADYADVRHFRAHRAQLKSTHRTMSKGRPSGSPLDGDYLTLGQRRMMDRFGRASPANDDRSPPRR
jgi:hypothetical protein